MRLNPGAKIPASLVLRLRASWLFSAVLGLVMVFAPLTRSQDSVASEDEVKAAFTYNFARFVEWPASAFKNDSTPISLGVVGNEEFADKLAALLRDKKAHGRSFLVKKIAFGPEMTSCHMIFVAQSQAKKFPQYSDIVAKAPILTVGESAHFLDQGGIINFVRAENQLRFEINSPAAEKVNLSISSKLLRLARNVKKGEESK
ncbi:MAG: hypothetical protein JWM99_2037 [Verrucomicrobiales bacterium]|nr:hypothetical protein [Verrucomicrobiales bacterium]